MCDTCNDCDNLTLPTGTAGADGAPGADGSAGAPGVNGTTILNNDLTPGSTSSLAYALFSSDKVYNVPAGTLSANGDKLDITASFTLSGTGIDNKYDRGYYQVLIGGTDIAGGLNSSPYGGGFVKRPSYTGEYYQFILKLEIHRISSTSVLIHSDSKWADMDGVEGDLFYFSKNSLTVADLSANALNIQIKGKVENANLSMACNQLNVNNSIQ